MRELGYVGVKEGYTRQVGEPLIIEAPGIEVLLCPVRDEQRAVALRVTDSRHRSGAILDRADVEALRDFCEIWLNQPED